MKYYVLLLLLVCSVFSCSSVKSTERAEKNVYVGQNRKGYLTFNDAVFRGPKENIERLLPNRVKYSPGFNVPEDVFLNIEYQNYRYKMQKVISIYKRDKEDFMWARVTFLPITINLVDIKIQGDIISIIISDENTQKVETIRYKWFSGNANYNEKYVRL